MTPDFAQLFVKMAAGLILVVVLAVVLLRVVIPRSSWTRRRRAEWAEVIGRFGLEPRKSLLAVKVLGRYFLLSSTEGSVSLIAELSKTEGEQIAPS